VKSTIQLYTGGAFNFADPDSSVYDIDDIAFALARVARFNGHTSCMYSVAEHSMYVADILPRELAFQGLMHDAHEAFMGDISSPMKAHLGAFMYAFEDRVAHAVRRRFGLPTKLDPRVKVADYAALLAERRDLLPSKDLHRVWDEWLRLGIEAHPTPIVGYEHHPSDEVAERFKSYFYATQRHHREVPSA
jgi:hypothetical protein